MYVFDFVCVYVVVYLFKNNKLHNNVLLFKQIKQKRKENKQNDRK